VQTLVEFAGLLLMFQLEAGVYKISDEGLTHQKAMNIDGKG